jgi:hypothetical protein
MSDHAQRITEYLTAGGLFNPEYMDHNAVRDLLMDCRDRIEALEAALNEIASEPTLRDLFAMAALEGVLANADSEGTAETFAKVCYKAADAMLEAREKKDD